MMPSNDVDAISSNERISSIIKSNQETERKMGSRGNASLVGVPILDSVEYEKKDMVLVTSLVAGDYLGDYEFVFDRASAVTARSSRFAECLILEYDSFEEVVAQMAEENSDLIVKESRHRKRSSFLKVSSDAPREDSLSVNLYPTEVKYIGRNKIHRQNDDDGLPLFLNTFILPDEILLRYMDINNLDGNKNGSLMEESRGKENEGKKGTEENAIASSPVDTFRRPTSATPTTKKSFLFIAKNLTREVRIS